jgi:hypothetical protein
MFLPNRVISTEAKRSGETPAFSFFTAPTLKNPSKNACQAPKPLNPNKTNQIEIAKEFHSIRYN